jgi:hypothetical protein
MSLEKDIREAINDEDEESLSHKQFVQSIRTIFRQSAPNAIETSRLMETQFTFHVFFYLNLNIKRFWRPPHAALWFLPILTDNLVASKSPERALFTLELSYRDFPTPEGISKPRVYVRSKWELASKCNLRNAYHSGYIITSTPKALLEKALSFIQKFGPYKYVDTNCHRFAMRLGSCLGIMAPMNILLLYACIFFFGLSGILLIFCVFFNLLGILLNKSLNFWSFISEYLPIYGWLFYFVVALGNELYKLLATLERITCPYFKTPENLPQWKSVY